VAFALAGVTQIAAAGPLPSGQNVVQGAATITAPTSNYLLVNVSTSKAVINWNSFSIDSGNAVQFIQPGITSVVLNRVTGGSSSVIAGNLLANGQVFLVNPNGVFFSSTAQVNVGGLVASTLNIADGDFMAGNYAFAKAAGAPLGQVVNSGTINIANGGYAALLGDQVSNSATGVINAPGGNILLAAGQNVTLTLGDSQLLSFSVDQQALANAAYVQNSGQLLADGGTVALSASVANAITSAVVNQSGLIRAQGVSQKNGEVYLSADGGDVDVAGTVDVSAQAGAQGGTIGVTSSGNIALTAGASLLANGAASGASSGGQISLNAAGAVTVSQTAALQARGGAVSGDGGGIAITGNSVEMRGQVDLTVASGALGSLSLNAGNLTIGQGNAPSDAACATPGTCASIYQQDAQSVLRMANLNLTASQANGDATLRVADLAANGGSGLIDGRNGALGGSLTLNASAPSGAASVQFDNPANSLYADGNINVSASGGSASGISVGGLSGANLDLRVALPSYVSGVSNSGNISAGSLSANGGSGAYLTLSAPGQVTLNGNAAAQSANGAGVVNLQGDAVNLGNTSVTSTGFMTSFLSVQSGNGGVTQGAGGQLLASTSATALQAGNAGGGAFAGVFIGGDGSHDLAGSLAAQTYGPQSQAMVQVSSSSGSLGLGQVQARADDGGYAATVSLSAAGGITSTGAIGSYAAAGAANTSISANGTVQLGGSVITQGASDVNNATIATISAGSGDLIMAAGTQINVVDTTAAGNQSTGAGLSLNASQGVLSLGTVNVSSNAGAAQALLYGNSGVTMNGNVAVSGQSAIADIGAGGSGTQIVLAAGKTVLAQSSTPGGGGAAVSVDNPGGSLKIDGTLSALAPAGNPASVVTDPVIALPDAGSSAAAAATAAAPGQSVLTGLLTAARTTPANPLASSGLIILPAWNIVTRSVRNGGGIDAAMSDDDGQFVIVPGTDTSVDDIPVNAALRQ
jgi:filamentous hemagglutinin family protein